MNMAITRHPPIRDQVANILRDAIVSLEFPPGQLLVERELCELTGASRPSVREAIRRLEAEGLVESLNGRGTIVRIVTPEEAAEVYEVRAELEGLAAFLFTQRADDKDREAMKSALEQLAIAIREKAETPEVLAAQGAFYAAMFHGARNTFLVETVTGMQTRVIQLRAITLQAPGRGTQSLVEVEEIGRLTLAGDAEGARRAATSHVQHAAQAAMVSIPPTAKSKF